MRTYEEGEEISDLTHVPADDGQLRALGHRDAVYPR